MIYTTHLAVHRAFTLLIHHFLNIPRQYRLKIAEDFPITRVCQTVGSLPLFVSSVVVRAEREIEWLLPCGNPKSRKFLLGIDFPVMIPRRQK